MSAITTKEQELEIRIERLESILMAHDEWIQRHVAKDQEFAENLRANMMKYES
jgi:hypothetical protein